MTSLCPECFDNRTFKRRLEEIRPKVGRGRCDFHPSRKGIPVEAVSEIVDEVFRNNFVRGDDSEHSECEPLADVLHWLTAADDEAISKAVADQLIEGDDPWPPDGDEAFYAEDFVYEQIRLQDHLHGALWRDFRESIVHGRRFFNDDARALLASIFQNIHLQRDVARNSPVYMLEPEAAEPFYRARIVSEVEVREIAKDPVAGLGPAPRLKGKAGRMNVSGVPAFYGSFDLETCAAELRPTVGSSIASGRFSLARALCVLDMTRFRKRPKQLDMFAKDHVRRLTQWRFMQRFRREMAKPISRDDEHINYVPTQVVAEYLNTVHQVRIGDVKRHIDAIIFNSAQNPDGRNIVVLGDAAIVEAASGADLRPVSGAAAPSLDLPVQERPKAPGLRLDIASITVAVVKSARIGLDNEETLQEHLDPAF